MNDLTITEYQLRSGMTSIYPESGTGSKYAVNYIILGMLGEAGEIANKFKKVDRDEDGILTDKKRRELADELGDVFWYVVNLASELGFSMETLANENLAKTQSRYDRGLIQGNGDYR